MSSNDSIKNKLKMKDDDEMKDNEPSDNLGEDQPIELLEHPSYKEMQNKLAQAEEKAAEYWDKLLRVQAEMGNTLRRSERDVANAHKYALEKFVSELLPVIDNLERAIATAEQNQMAENILEGLHMTLKVFHSVLAKFGVQVVNPENEAFNPEFHQAISAQVDNKVKPGTVLSVLQKGYLLNERLVRPALVVVSKADG